VEFRLLGTVEARIDGRAIDLGPARQRCVLVALLIDVNHVVLVEQLLDRVWGDRRPHRARGTLYSYLSRLRLALAGVDSLGIAHRSGGYVLTADPATVDLHRFRQLVSQARTSDNQDRAAALFEQALELWRGDPFATLDTPWLNRVRAVVEAERRAAELDHNDLELRRGRHTDLLADLATRAADHPLDERLAGQRMLALYRSGRPAESLQVYQDTRAALVDELGLEPGPELHQLHQRILAADPTLTTPAAANAGVRSEPTVVPRQLPVDVTHFTGRESYLTTLHTLLGSDGESRSSAVVITAIDGTAGVGKTALAVHFAHRVADRFPDGQLYIDLRGYAATAPATAAEALGWMLRSLGVPPERIPAEQQEQAALYRSVLAGKRVLVMLDNARSATQVTPLLPASQHCLVVITSRTTLATLDGSTHLHLDILSEQEALTLLAQLAGPDRVQREHMAAATLVALCSRLPLAVRIAGARLAARPTWTIAALVDRLADETRRLDELRVGERAVRASFAVTYRALKTSDDPVDQDAARMFRLLGVLDWVQMSVPVAAALLDQPQADAAAALEHLLDAHLLDSARPGRYHTHDLLRLYARDEAQHDLPEPERQAALRRALDCYLAAAEQATLLISPMAAGHVGAERTRSPHGGFELSRPADLSGWTDAEHANLVAAAQQAAAISHTADRAVRLTAALHRPFNTRAYWRDLMTLRELAARTARHLGDRPGEALAHEDLAWANIQYGRPNQAIASVERAMAIWRELGDLRGEASCRIWLGHAYFDQWQLDEAVTRHQQALAIFSDIGDSEGEARALNALGLDHQRLRRLDEAIAYHQRSLAIYRKLRHRSGMASALGNLGWAHYRAGRHEAAITYQQQALTLASEVGHRYEEAEFLWALGQTHHALGNHDEARTYWQHSITILHDVGALTTDQANTLRRQPIPHTPEIIQRNI
jgi:DNA-binding SARP family transcriptional activator/tetratricopeptide (TPR) repeat protein